MKCLRCGYCCIELDVIIVDPKYINEDLDFNNESISEKLIHKKSNEWCPHLYERNGFYTCIVHNKAWFKNTPCFEYTQIEKSDSTKCRMGVHINNKPTTKAHLKSLENRGVH